jgi:glutathione S-transferase
VYLTLKNLGLEFEVSQYLSFIYYDKPQKYSLPYHQSKIVNVMAGENKSDEFLKLNPQGTIPVVVDDDFPMSESRAICCYLADAKSPGNTLYPADDFKARYIIDQRLYYDATAFNSVLLRAVVSCLFGFCLRLACVLNWNCYTEMLELCTKFMSLL